MADRPARTASAPTPPAAAAADAVVVAVLLIGFSLFAGIWTDKLWFSSLGYGEVFSKLLWTRVLLFVVFGGAMALVVGRQPLAGLPAAPGLPAALARAGQPRALPRGGRRRCAGCC